MSQKYNRKDEFYKKAKAAGYRSRAAYKLLELNKRFHLLNKGYKVLDLGAWPGGWLQVAADKVGPVGQVVGIDLKPIEDFEAKNIQTFVGDVCDEEALRLVSESVPDGFDLVLSDMSPKITGIREVDAVASVGLAEKALWSAQKMLRPGGTLVIKLFPNNDTEIFVKNLRGMFNKLTRVHAKTTRRSSNEFYLVASGLKQSQETLQAAVGSM